MARYKIEPVSGINNIHLCGLMPEGVYSIIAVSPGDDQETAFSWDIKGPTLFQQDTQDIHRIIITPNTTCVILALDIETKANSVTLPMYLSISRMDETRPSGWLEHFLDQAEMANLSTTGSVAASNLISNVLIGGNCFDISNVTSTGNPSSRGTFTNGGTNIGINTGMVLSTGPVSVLPGPNNLPDASGGYSLVPTNDPDLATLTGGVQHDLSKIEFDFRPTSTTVSFDFVFGSEEYCEYVNSGFNDVFGFFISGPGITGNKNIALVPSSSTPVSINNVNHLSNSGYFVGNSALCGSVANPAECQLDGWTSVFTATTDVNPCSTYHIKLAIADVGDEKFTSAVFLRANSFDAGGTVKADAVYPGAPQYVYEACGQGYIRFTRQGGDINTDYVVDFSIGGTATPGDDYLQINSPVIIPAGQASILIPINVFPDMIAEGTETIVLTLDNACSCTQTQITFNIQDLQPLAVNLSNINACGSSSATLSPMVTNGQAPMTYAWSNGATSPTLNVAAPGVNTYTVTVTDACGRTSSAQATVTLAPVPTAALSGSGTFCVGSSNPVNLTLTLGGPGDWTVTLLSNGVPSTATYSSSPVMIPANSSGTYSLVSVMSANGCTGTVSGVVNLPQVDVNLNLTPTNPSCYGLTNGTISSTPSGGTGPYTYAWTPSGSGANPNNLAPGTYSVTVTSSQGCTETASVTLTEPPLLMANTNTPGNIDCFTPNAAIDLTVSGGTPNYNYTWSNGSSIQDPSVTMGGTYTVTVRDAKNCTTTATVSVTANTTQPTAVIAPPAQLNCNTLNLNLDASGSSQGAEYLYQWSGPGIICCNTTLQPQINQGGTYILTVTNSTNGCTKTVSVNVQNNNTPPNANATAPFNIGCNHPTVTLSGAGSATGAGITYQWFSANGNIQSGSTTLNPIVNQAGTFTLTVTNGNTGCTSEATVTITGNTQAPTAVVAPAGMVDCNNPVIQLNGTGSSQAPPTYNYNWTGGTIVSGGTTLTPSVSAGGTYTLVVTNPANNCTASTTVTVAANLAQPTAVASAPNGINCQNATVTLNGAGSSTGANFSYQWTTANGNILSGENTLNPVANQGGNYILVVTNTSNGCTKQVLVNVTQDQSVPQANAGPDRVLNCITPFVILTGSASQGPGYTFTWSANPGGFSSGQNSLNPTVNQPGTYTLAVSNNNTGCTSSDVVVVTANFSTPMSQIVPPAILTCESPTIQLDGSNSTSGPLITYAWTALAGGQIMGSNSDAIAVAGAPGTYRLLVTNVESGCTAQSQVSVTRNTNPPLVEAGPNGNITCQNPTVTLNGAGSSIGPNYTYQWTTTNGNIVSGDHSLAPVVDLPGVYTLVVTSLINGCTAQDFANITTNQNIPVAVAGPDLERNCSITTLMINGNNSSIGPGIQYQWTANPGNIFSGATTRTPTVNQAGVYTLLVTNTTTGCTDTDEVIVTNNMVNPVPAVATPAVITCYVPVVELDATGSTMVGSAIYNWSTTNGFIVTGSDSPVAQINAPGIYRLTITNGDNACSATAQVTVTQNTTPPNAAASVNAILSCQNAQVQLSGTGSSIGGQYQYQWTTSNGHIVNGAQTLTPMVDLEGTYTLSVLSTGNGCTNTAPVQVQSSQQYPVANAGPPQTLTCATTALALNASGSSQGSSYTYIWDSSDGNIVSGDTTLQPMINAPGTYNLTIINQINGCISNASVVVGTNYTAPSATVAPGGILSCTVSTLSLDGTGSSAGNQYSYHWLTQNGNFVSGDSTLQPNVNAIGGYTLVVTNNNNGCTSTASTTVQADASLPVANAGMPDTLTCTVSSVVLNATTSSQGTDYTYTWNGPGNITTYTGLQPVVNEPGDYFLTVTNTSNGCTALSTVVIQQDITTPVAEAGPINELTCTKMQLALNSSGSSSGPLYQYSWTASNGGQISMGANTSTPTVNQPGMYHLLVTNTFNNCIAVDSVAITQDIAIPLAEAGPGSLLTCIIPSVTLAGQGSSGALFVYSWTTTDGNIASGDSTLTPVVDAPGTYNLLVTNTYNGCSITDNVYIDRNEDVPSAVAEVSAELNCVTPSLTLSGVNSSQGATLVYTWTTGNGYIVSGENTLAPIVNLPGQYTLEVFNTTNSCMSLSTVTVAENLTAPVAQSGSPQVLSCAQPILTLDGTGSSAGNQYTYLWDTPNGNILSGEDMLAPEVDQSGSYDLVVTDQTNGCTAHSTVQILLDVNTPEADAGISPTLTCAVTTLNLDGTSSSTGAQFSYQWSTSDGDIMSGDTSLTPLIAAPGTYSLLITNIDNGCTSDATVLVNQNIAPPMAAAGNESFLSCTTLTTSLNVSGSSTGPDFTYSWTTMDGTIISGDDTEDPVIGDPGTYELMVLNTATGCTNTASVEVPEDVTLPNAAAAVSAELTCTTLTLPLSGNGSSTGADFAYSWTTTSSGHIVSGLTDIAPVVDAPGNYQLMVTNNINGCTSTAAVPVLQNIMPPNVNATVNALLTCTVNQVQLQGTATGGAQGVSYAWTGQGIVSGGTSSTPTVNAIGQYILTATDLYNGCIASAPVTVLDNINPPAIAIAAPAQLNCNIAQTVLNGSGSTGSQFTYAWTGPGIVLGPTTLTPTINAPGTYNLLISNTSNGCTSAMSTLVTQNIQAPVAQAGGAFELTCSLDKGALNASGSTTGTGINYVWSTANGHIIAGNNTATPTVDAPGLYALTVTNTQNGCTSLANVAVTENTNYPASVSLTRILPKCGGKPGSLVIQTVNGGVGPYLYSIDGGNNFLTANEFTGITPGTYAMVVQDVNGCEYEQSLTFPVPLEPQVSLTPDVTLVFGQDAKLVAALNIPLSQIDTIIWDPAETLEFTNKPNEVIARPFHDTEYTVRIINLDGCEDVAKVIVRVQDPQIWAPNVFSPLRKDGNSDYFLIFASDRTVNKIHSFQVYDRWGTLIYRKVDLLPNEENSGWDGSYNGKTLTPAVFVWWADVELADGRHILMKGDVTLVE